MRETVTISLPQAIRRELDRVAKEEGRFTQRCAPTVAGGFPLRAAVPTAPPTHDGRRAGARHLHRRGRVYPRLVRLLLDTNVLVAALIARGTCSDLLEHCVRHHVVISSRPLLDELHDVLSRKFRQRAADVRATVRLFEETFTLVTPVPLEAPACRDPDDDIVLATARAGECVAIVTGDQDLLVLDPFQGIRLLTPSAFWKWESEADDG